MQRSISEAVKMWWHKPVWERVENIVLVLLIAVLVVVGANFDHIPITEHDGQYYDKFLGPVSAERAWPYILLMRIFWVVAGAYVVARLMLWRSKRRIAR